ncbi:hypothetical protein ACFSNO_17755 [Streptomyces cirratus]
MTPSGSPTPRSPPSASPTDSPPATPPAERAGPGWSTAPAAAPDALGLGSFTGTVTEGAAADFLLIDISTPEMRLSWDLPWELVRRGNRDQISAVFVGGRLRLWRGWPTDWDGPALVRQAVELSRSVLERAAVTRTTPPPPPPPPPAPAATADGAVAR